jgi:hypothetical protein
VAKSATADFREQRVSKRRKREARCHIPGRAQRGPGSRANDRALRPLPWLPDAGFAAPGMWAGAIPDAVLASEAKPSRGKPSVVQHFAPGLLRHSRSSHGRLIRGSPMFSAYAWGTSAFPGGHIPGRAQRDPGSRSRCVCPWVPDGPSGLRECGYRSAIPLTQTSEAQRHIPGRRRRPGVQGKRHDLKRLPLGPECRFAAPGMWCSSVTPRAKSKHRPSPMRA